VARAGADEEAQGDRARGRAGFTDELQAVGQPLLVEWHGILLRGFRCRVGRVCEAHHGLGGPRRLGPPYALRIQLEWFGAERNNREVAWREAVEVLDDARGRQTVDRRLDLVEAAHAAEVVPVRRQRSGPGRSGFLLHDERRLQPGLDALDFLR